MRISPSSSLSPIKAIILAASALVLFTFAYTVWPTAYRYDRVELSGTVLPVRMHRLTGRTEILRGVQGWTPVSNDPGVKTQTSASTLSAEQLSKLEGTLEITDYGWIKAQIYNGADRPVDRVRVEVVVLNGLASERLRRTYDLTSTGGERFASSEFIANCGFTVQRGETIRWRIMSATAK